MNLSTHLFTFCNCPQPSSFPAPKAEFNVPLPDALMFPSVGRHHKLTTRAVLQPLLALSQQRFCLARSQSPPKLAQLGLTPRSQSAQPHLLLPLKPQQTLPTRQLQEPALHQQVWVPTCLCASLFAWQQLHRYVEWQQIGLLFACCCTDVFSVWHCLMWCLPDNDKLHGLLSGHGWCYGVFVGQPVLIVYGK